MFKRPIKDIVNITNKGKNIDIETGIFPLLPNELNIKFM